MDVSACDDLNPNHLWHFTVESLMKLWQNAGLTLLRAEADQSVVGPPIGIDYTGDLQQFETATDFNDQVINSGFTTGWFQIQDGKQAIFLERMNPDFSLNAGGSITLTPVPSSTSDPA